VSKLKRRVAQVALGLLPMVVAASGFAQNQAGTLRGVVLDQQGKSVVQAKLTATNENTRKEEATITSSAGVYEFPDLQVGSYALRVEAPGFTTYVRTGIHVLAARVTDVTATLRIGPTTTELRVAAGANAVQTESSQLSGSFEGREISDIPVATGANLSVLNLSIFLPNTTTALGGTSGTGGAVGGLRGRQNSFAIDGVDNNDPEVTVAAQQMIPDAVQEVTVNQNVFSAEYGRGSGGQFNVITKTGTDQLHFSAWFYNSNRAYNAASNQDLAQIQAGTLPGKPRFDFNRAGAEIGGPVIPNRLFLYGAYEFDDLGQQATAPSTMAPTAAGMATLNTLASDTAVKGLLAQFPVASAQTGTVTVNGNAIPIGPVTSVAPSYTRDQDYIINGDLSINPHQDLHVRYLKNRSRQPDFGIFPQAQFASFAAVDNRRLILEHVWTATPRMVNDLHATFSRYTEYYPLSGNAQQFPDLYIADLGAVIGPNLSLPELRVYNEYLLGDSLTWTVGRHTVKWGGQYYWFTSPSDFLQYQRGLYGYATLSQLINDRVPGLPGFTLQGIGSGYFAGNSKNFNLFVQDDIKVTPRLTLNVGLRYDFFGNPAGARLNALNAIASVPGTPLVFGVPKQDWNNWGPRLGLAWDPTGSGKWSVRAGGGVVYDWIPWNFYVNGVPIEQQAILTPASACLGTFGGPPAWCSSGNGFLVDGALNQTFVPPSTAATARALTSQTMADAKAPKVFSWTLGLQHEIFRNTTVELRYLGTRALELPVQFQLNSITAFDNGAEPLPTYINPADIPATVPAEAPTLAQFLSHRALRYASDGFTGGFITEAAPLGASTYHGGSIELLHRFDYGLFLRANYTFSKTMDDATNDLNTSAVNPRRPQDPYNLRDEWARSALDVRNKVAITFVYDLPRAQWQNSLLRGLANGWEWSGSFLSQTGQPITIQSGVDSNGNGDAAGDRAILNPVGLEGVGSLVEPVCRDAATGATSIDPSCAATNVVGYAATNPNARYIQAGVGALSTLGRNSFTTPGFNVWNMAFLKETRIRERMDLQFRVEAYNVFNHPNYTLGDLSVFPSTSNALNPSYASLTGVPTGTFLNSHVFTDAPRQIVLGIKINY
jgi:outer membrane receptor protein involved in Fe transport